MKAKLAVLLLCSGIFSCGVAFSCGDSGCGQTDECGNTVSSGSGCGYEDWDRFADSRPVPCDCDCSDKGWRYNDCISKSRYCEAFGNIGAR